MNTLQIWAARHGVTPGAIEELINLMTVTSNPSKPGSSEAENQANVRLLESQLGGRLWRNNVGVAYSKTGSIVRFGLANDSKKMNKQVKSSDLIGIHPITITPTHVGKVIGQFRAREVKPTVWKFTGTSREKAQLRYMLLVNSMGGDAQFTTGGL